MEPAGATHHVGAVIRSNRRSSAMLRKSAAVVSTMPGYLIVRLPAMNNCYLLCVLVDESTEDGRASPNMLRSHSGGDQVVANLLEELVCLAGWSG
jgi:hypothetical protein